MKQVRQGLDPSVPIKTAVWALDPLPEESVMVVALVSSNFHQESKLLCSVTASSALLVSLTA